MGQFSNPVATHPCTNEVEVTPSPRQKINQLDQFTPRCFCFDSMTENFTSSYLTQAPDDTKNNNVVISDLILEKKQIHNNGVKK